MRIHFILLAAGLSRRYGKRMDNKLLMQLEEKPMYEHVLDRLIQIKDERDNIDDLTVVTNAEEIYDSLRDRKGIMCVKNDHPEKGISSSLRVGMTVTGCLLVHKLKHDIRIGASDDCHELMNKKHCLVCFVADQPNLKKDTILDFLDQFEKSEKDLGCMKQGEHYGNPCIFSDKYWGELDELKGDVGGKKIIRAHLQDTFFYEMKDPKELRDIDTEEDYHEAVCI